MRITAINYYEFAENCVRYKNARIRAEGDHLVFLTGASKIADSFASWKGRRVLGQNAATYRDLQHTHVYKVLNDWKNDLPNNNPWRTFGTGQLMTATCFSGEMESFKSKKLLKQIVENVKGEVSQEQVVKALQKLLRKEQQFKGAAVVVREHQANETEVDGVGYQSPAARMSLSLIHI
jgi:hypothetical protein